MFAFIIYFLISAGIILIAFTGIITIGMIVSGVYNRKRH